METETEHFVDNYRKRYFNYVLHLLIKFFGNSRRDFFLDNGKKKTFSVVLVAISEFFKYKSKNNDKEKNNKTANKRKKK